MANCGINGIEGADDALLHLFALHDGREELDVEMEAVVVVGQLTAEVAIAGSIGGGDDGNALGKGGDAQLALQVEDTLFLQLSDNFLTLACHVAEGIGGVDVADNPRETVRLVELSIYLQQYLHACP